MQKTGDTGEFNGGANLEIDGNGAATVETDEDMGIAWVEVGIMNFQGILNLLNARFGSAYSRRLDK